MPLAGMHLGRNQSWNHQLEVQKEYFRHARHELFIGDKIKNVQFLCSEYISFVSEYIVNFVSKISTYCIEKLIYVVSNRGIDG